MSTCYKTSNNKHFGCPPRMDDARHFTDYRPVCHLNNLIKAENSVSNSFNYRNFLQQNAEQLMEINRKHACMKNCCGPCAEPFQNGTMLPELNKWSCNANTCKLVPNDPNGLGTGRIYSEKGPNCPGLPAAWPITQGINSCVPPHDNFRYYPDHNTNGPQAQRVAVPGGGNPLSGGDPKVYN